jgi:hypothetical protein
MNYPRSSLEIIVKDTANKWFIKVVMGSKVEEQFRLLWISTVIKRETTQSKVTAINNQ